MPSCRALEEEMLDDMPQSIGTAGSTERAMYRCDISCLTK